MMKTLFYILPILSLTTSCGVQEKIASHFESVKSRMNSVSDDKQIEQIELAIKENSMDKAQQALATIQLPFHRVQALALIGEYQIRDQQDLVAAKKTMESIEDTLSQIWVREDKIYAQIEFINLKYFIDREASEKQAKELNEKIWTVVSPEERSHLLIRMLQYQLGTQKDIKAAKKAIEQTQKTISFIQDDQTRLLREKQLGNFLQVNNHILCQ